MTTIARALTTIRCERMLARPAQISVRVGQEVSPVQVVARAALDTGFRIIRAAEALGLSPQELSATMQVEVGAAVQKGTPLVRSKAGLFGRGARRLPSPVDGFLHQVYDGLLILRQAPELVELRAMVQGRIAGLLGNRGVTIETNGSQIQAWWDNGLEAYGRLKVLASTPDALLSSTPFGADARGAILVAGRVDDATLLQSAEETGVRGIIAGSMTADLCRATAAFSLPIVLTEGVGFQSMAEPIFKLLRESEGREASLFSRNTDRPGSRPEIIIPVPIALEPEGSPGGEQPITVGQTARILRAPYASQVGRVVAAYSRPRPTAIGTRALGADLQLPGGEVVFVPYANLDVIT